MRGHDLEEQFTVRGVRFETFRFKGAQELFRLEQYVTMVGYRSYPLSSKKWFSHSEGHMSR